MFVQVAGDQCPLTCDQEHDHTNDGDMADII